MGSYLLVIGSIETNLELLCKLVLQDGTLDEEN